MEDGTARPQASSVLIVDDHRMFAEAIRLRLVSTRPPDRAFEPVATAYSLEMARVALNRSVPDLVLLDFRLGDARGLELFTDLRALPRPPVTLILTASTDTSHVIDGLCHASGWVSKSAPFTELLRAVEVVLAGRTYVAPTLLGAVLDQLLRESGRLAAPTTFLALLSERELQVLRCLVSGMTRHEVAAHLFISPNTVRTHVQNLLRHAEVHSTLALISAARELGVTGVGSEVPS